MKHLTRPSNHIGSFALRNYYYYILFFSIFTDCFSFFLYKQNLKKKLKIVIVINSIY
jgi:hypothetical protein